MVTVNKERCIELIQNFLVPSLQQSGLEMNFLRFQQDGATVHTSDVSMAILQRLFPGHLISQFGDVAWPAHSPDLTACDFGYGASLRAKFMLQNIPALPIFKNASDNEIASISTFIVYGSSSHGEFPKKIGNMQG